jgi:hypothetical protein
MWRRKTAPWPLDGPFQAQRHITTDATLRIKCGAPHLMRESRTSGSARGGRGNPVPYRDNPI